MPLFSFLGRKPEITKGLSKESSETRGVEVSSREWNSVHYSIRRNQCKLSYFPSELSCWRGQSYWMGEYSGAFELALTEPGPASTPHMDYSIVRRIPQSRCYDPLLEMKKVSHKGNERHAHPPRPIRQSQDLNPEPTHCINTALRNSAFKSQLCHRLGRKQVS